MEEAIRQRQLEQRQEREWYKKEERARLDQMEREIMLARGEKRQEDIARKAKLDAEIQALEEHINKEVFQVCTHIHIRTDQGKPNFATQNTSLKFCPFLPHSVNECCSN
jgi:hypothetical protein